MYGLISDSDNRYGAETERIEFGLPRLVLSDIRGYKLDRTGREELFNP